MIVTVTPTVMDGTVVRWYRSDAAEKRGVEMLSASPDGVHIGCFLHEVPADAMRDAQAAYEALRRDRGADVSHLATHRRRGLFGTLEPVAAPAEGTPHA